MTTRQASWPAWLVRVAMVALLSLWPLSCGADRSGFAGDAGSSFASSDAAVEASGCGGLRCSRDLKRVEDGCGAVSLTCGPDQGCANATCVDACTSAAAAAGSIGCSFWTLPPDDLAETGDSCFASIVANTWDKAVTIAAEYEGAPLDLSRSTYTFTPGSAGLQLLAGPLPPSGLAVVFLSPGPTTLSGYYNNFTPCPDGTTPALSHWPSAHGAARTKAIHLSTDAPVSAYSVFPYGGAKSYVPSATLLLPTPSWGTNYVAVDAWEGALLPFIQIVADGDDTTVRIRPTVDLGDGVGFTGGARGVVQTFLLKRGEVLQFSQTAALVGSVIESTLPVALFGGNTCMNIPNGTVACDTAQQQIAPIAQWGNRYALVPHRSRFPAGADGARPPEDTPWRLVGAASGTALSYDPAPPDGAPSTLDVGQSVAFWSKAPFVVRSQDADHPFYAAAYMTGEGYVYASGNPDGPPLGDPEFVNVIPVGQYLDDYVLAIDATFRDSWLDLVRQKTPSGFADVTLDCVTGPLVGWVDVGAAGDLQSLSVTLGAGQGAGCGYGRHHISSAAPFATTVWGIDSYASYAYPGGAGSRPITTVRVPVK